MRKNGRAGSEQDYSTSSFFGSGFFSLLGGIGLGAGLLYFMDPENGPQRRRRISRQASDLASSASHLAGQTFSSARDYLTHARDYAQEKFGDARDYAAESLASGRKSASDTAQDWRNWAAEKISGETRASHRLGVSVCALSSMALGALLMYVFDPAAGASRRRFVRQQFEDYGRKAGDALRSGYGTVRETVSNAASQVASATGMSSGQSSAQSRQGAGA